MEARPSLDADETDVASSWQKIAESMIGRVIGGRLSLERVLGIGGTATVYAARHRNGRGLAVKILHPELANHASIRQRFLAEGYAANKVDHPDAVAVLDDGEDPDGTVFIVMELLRGRTFMTRLSEDGTLPTGSVVSMALSVLSVLARAHERGVLHRDVKPSNIFETDEGRIKLLDFGIARIQDGQGAFTTRPGTTLGTPAFMAPELAGGRLEQLDALTDIWALAATMFQLLSGEVVHDSRNDNELLVLAATQPARSLATLRPDLDSALVRVIDRALSFERRERWPNARAMSSALSATVHESGWIDLRMPTPEPEQSVTAPEMALPAPRPPQPVAKSMRWAAGLAFALAVAGSVFAMQYRATSDVQAKSGEAPLPPAPTRLTSAGSPRLPVGPSALPLASAALMPSARPSGADAALAPEPHAGNTAPRASSSKRSAPVGPATVSTAVAKNPLFFPSQ